MGGLFSSDTPTPPVNRYRESSSYYVRPYENEDYLYRRILEEQERIRALRSIERSVPSYPSYRTNGGRDSTPTHEVQRLTNQFAQLSIEPDFFKPIPVKTNAALVDTISDGKKLRNLSAVYETDVLPEQHFEFQHVKTLFRSTNKKCFKITKIEKVNNPYLLAQYNLKKLECVRWYGHCVEEELFHGTKLENIKDICTGNFDWRLKGTAKGHRFGQGVSFTPISNYATNYGDKTVDKVMILAKVLVCSVCTGKENMIVPIEGYDTSAKEDRHVYVKYEDNTFYPAYVIHYSGIDPMSNNHRKRRIQKSPFLDY